MQGKKQELEWDMEKWYDSKLGKKYIKAVYCHPACLTYMLNESESHSAVYDSLQTHGLSPRNSPGKNTGVGSLSLLQGIFPTQGSNLGLQISHIAGRFFTSWTTREAQEYWSEMLGWIRHKLESKLPGEISITSDMQTTAPLWQKVNKN